VTRPVASQDGLHELESLLGGPVLGRDHPDYDRVRRVWNAGVDKRPTLIARCRGPVDVTAAVRFARARALPVSVRGGGHNVAGKAVVDDGLMIDLSLMQSARVDLPRRRVRVEPGSTLRVLDVATAALGVVTPAGIVSHTGVAGLTLGGGQGWLSRKHGYSVDNLTSVDLVLADGTMTTASESDNAELFWGVRGGGGNFGVVTSFEYHLHPLGPAVLAGVFSYAGTDAAPVLRRYRDYVAGAPRELTCFAVLTGGPAAEQRVVLAVCYAGDLEQGERLVAPLGRLGRPLAADVQPRPFTDWQTYFDPEQRPGLYNYWKSHYLAELTDSAIDTLVAHMPAMRSPLTCVFLVHLGGAVADVDENAMAFGHRRALFNLELLASTVHADDLAADAEWARATWRAMRGYGMGTVYINNLDSDDGTDRVRDAYGPEKYARLARLKRIHDPDNLFSSNHNILPAATP
jgi:FAD/FMN-containing dehydrogenase